MPRLKFTSRNVVSIKPPAQGRTDYWDADLKGFGLRVSESGRKTWVAMYRLDGDHMNGCVCVYSNLWQEASMCN